MGQNITLYYTKGLCAPQGLEGIKMAGISRYEKAVLALTAAFLLFTGGWFLAKQNAAAPYEVSTSGNRTQLPAASATEEEPVRPDSLMDGETIDLNQADEYELRRLPGIGEKRARDIVAYREEHGPFRSGEELDEVDGIGPGILSGLADYVTVSPTD